MENDKENSKGVIKKIYMKGFKTFQRQTAIPFYPGLTAIVGSNGSGKSNVMDAVRFVMGRRSSQLRAEKLDQLIFKGNDKKSPSKEALVRLYLDNSDGRFNPALEENSKEVVIGRKINRNGYSTYRFQGNNCKRSKIDEVLDLAGVGKSNKHFVRQGEVTDIVERTPVERRKIVDRISGIESYEKKKQKSLDELEEVEKKLQGLEIKKEMKRDRLEALEEQKKDAEKLLELEKEKKNLKYSVLKARQDALKSQIEALGESDKEGEIEEKEKKLEKIDDELEELEERKDEIDDEITKEKDSNIVTEIERIKGKIERKKDKIDNRRDKIEDIEQLLKDYEKLSDYSGRNRAVKKVLQKGFEGVHGTVGQLIHYKDRYAVGIETAAGGKIDNIVVDSQEVANKCINFLKKNRVGRATFLPLDKVSKRRRSSSSKRAVKMAGVVDFALNLVDYDKQFERAISYVLGDTLVCESLNSVSNAGRVRAVSLDGDIMRKGGSMTGGKSRRRRSKRKSSGSSLNPEKKKKQKEQLREEIKDLKSDIGTLNSLLEDKKEEEEKKSQVSDELKEERKKVREDIKEKRKERKELAEEVNRLKRKIGSVRKKRARFEGELENIKEDLEPYNEEEMERVEGEVTELKSKKSSVVRKINRLGNVNMRAIQEYEEFKEEYDEFKDKVNSIKDEKDEIEEMIAEIEAKKKEKFMNSMNAISKKFGELFEKLFEGGEAYLELEEEGNIDSGLVLRAKPPNKDPHTIDSLSGGETTLTAISFVFAIQEYDPSPFYLMDEIDAALDHKNAKILSNVLREYSSDSQVIMISHKEQTVRHADRVYGVSMRDGVSKVRSIEL